CAPPPAASRTAAPPPPSARTPAPRTPAPASPRRAWRCLPALHTAPEVLQLVRLRPVLLEDLAQAVLHRGDRGASRRPLLLRPTLLPVQRRGHRHEVHTRTPRKLRLRHDPARQRQPDVQQALLKRRVEGMLLLLFLTG